MHQEMLPGAAAPPCELDGDLDARGLERLHVRRQLDPFHDRARVRRIDRRGQLQLGIGRDRPAGLSTHAPGGAHDADPDHAMASLKAPLGNGPNTVRVIGCESTRSATRRASCSVTCSIRESV